VDRSCSWWVMRRRRGEVSPSRKSGSGTERGWWRVPESLEDTSKASSAWILLGLLLPTVGPASITK
jgi:hypothetical protein